MSSTSIVPVPSVSPLITIVAESDTVPLCIESTIQPVPITELSLSKSPEELLIITFPLLNISFTFVTDVFS